MALKEIDELIDVDIKSEITKFNPEQNEELRMKLLSLQSSYIPLREVKLEKLVDCMIENKDKFNQNKDVKFLNMLEEGKNLLII